MFTQTEAHYHFHFDETWISQPSQTFARVHMWNSDSQYEAFKNSSFQRTLGLFIMGITQVWKMKASPGGFHLDCQGSNLVFKKLIQSLLKEELMTPLFSHIRSGQLFKKSFLQDSKINNLLSISSVITWILFLSLLTIVQSILVSPLSLFKKGGMKGIHEFLFLRSSAGTKGSGHLVLYPQKRRLIYLQWGRWAPVSTARRIGKEGRWVKRWPSGRSPTPL